MVATCIRALKELDSIFLNEIGRLEELRLRELRSRLVGMPSAKSNTISHPRVATKVSGTIPVERLRVGDDEGNGISLYPSQ